MLLLQDLAIMEHYTSSIRYSQHGLVNTTDLNTSYSPDLRREQVYPAVNGSSNGHATVNGQGTQGVLSINTLIASHQDKQKSAFNRYKSHVFREWGAIPALRWTYSYRGHELQVSRGSNESGEIVAAMRQC